MSGYALLEGNKKNLESRFHLIKNTRHKFLSICRYRIRSQDNYQVMRAQCVALVSRTNSLGTTSHIQEGAILLIDLFY
jgi:hypothetical protein